MWTKSLGSHVGDAKQKKKNSCNPGVVLNSCNPSTRRRQGDLSFNAASTMPNKESGGGGERKKVQGRNERRRDGKERKGRERREEWEGEGRDED